MLELQTLCHALNIAHSGSKAKVTERILDMWAIRSALQSFNTLEEVKAAFSAIELKTMCKTIRKYQGGNKRTKAATLLNWRNTCRRKGQEFVAGIQAKVATIKILGVWGPM
jgi:hypothetical protein